MLLCNYTNWASKVRTMSASLYVYVNERLRKNERENETTLIFMSMHGSQKDLDYFALACWVSSSHERVYITALSKKNVCWCLVLSLFVVWHEKERMRTNERWKNKILAWQSLFSNNSPFSRKKVADFQKWTLNVLLKLKHWRMLSIELRLYI